MAWRVSSRMEAISSGEALRSLRPMTFSRILPCPTSVPKLTENCVAASLIDYNDVAAILARADPLRAIVCTDAHLRHPDRGRTSNATLEISGPACTGIP